jgi:chloramphenicol 3-O-phosphotransferase
VVLPAPLGPSNPRISFGRNSRSTPETAVWGPYFTTIPWARSTPQSYVAVKFRRRRGAAFRLGFTGRSAERPQRHHFVRHHFVVGNGTWPNDGARVVLFTGASSTGKTTVARLVHRQSPLPTVLLLGDALRLARPSAGADWLQTLDATGLRAFQLDFDRAYYAALAAFPRHGFHVIGEVSLRDQGRRALCEAFLTSVPHLLVRLFCDGDIRNQRERSRQDVPAGLSDETARREITDLDFDLVIDTGTVSPEQAAALVCERLASPG